MAADTLPALPLQAPGTALPLHAPGTAQPLRARGLTLRLGGRRVVDDVSLALPRGQWAAIVGPNGAGKSTLLQLLAGLRAADAGTVLLHDRPLHDWPARDRARHLAWLSQQGEADGDIAVRDVVRLGRLPRHGLLGAPDASDAAAVSRAMTDTETTALAERRLGELSGGERQRVLLARALAVEAGVLLLDEPTTHLDAPHQRALLKSLAARARDGVAVAAVMHDVTLALAADRVLVMDRGRLVADGAPDDAVLRTALVAVFDAAFSIEAVATSAGRRWVALPAL